MTGIWQDLEEQIQKLENEKERDIVIHHKHHRTFTSNKREKIKELQETFKVLIMFPNPGLYIFQPLKTDDFVRWNYFLFFFFGAGENSDVVKIKGQKDDVDKCYKHLSKVVKEMNENSYSIEVPIFKQLHKCIIGRGGANIKK